MEMMNRAVALLKRVTLVILDKTMTIRIFWDMKTPWVEGGPEPRVYLQIVYKAFDTKTNDGVYKEWRGRKWQLSEHMTDDEIIKTAYAAFEAAVKHEAMEGFKVDGITLFNPHVDFEELLKISHKEVKRKENESTPST
jgi:hypothetical protein